MKYRSLIAICLTSVLLTGLFAGCGSSVKVPEADASELAAAASGEPVTVTMFGYWPDVKSEEPFASFTAALAKEYPEITLEYESFPTGTLPYTDELTRRLDHGQETDIIMTANSDLWDSGKLMDLTEQEFSGRYSIAAMKQLSGNGSVYFLPGVGSVQCYAYNADWLAELEIEPPVMLGEMETMMGKISEAGGHPFIVPFEQTNPLFIKALAAGYLATPDGQMWLESYNQGGAAMSENMHWIEVWQRAERMVAKGYITAEDALFAENRRAGMLAQGLGVMSMIASPLVSTLDSKENNKQGFQFGLLPLLGDKPENQTVFSAPTCYFAVSKRVSQPGNEAKRDAVMKILDFISTEAGQQAMRTGSPLANSYLTGVKLQLGSQAQPVAKVLSTGSFTAPPVFERGVEKVLGDAFGKIISGEMTAEQAMEACDWQNAAYKAAEISQEDADLEILGTASEDFPWTFRSSRTQELAVTNFAVDSMRIALGTELALELGTAVRGEFFSGDVTARDIQSVIRVDKKLYRAQVTGQQIWDLIEQGVKADNSSWFVVASGLKYSYQPMKGETPGKLLSLAAADGAALDLTKTYEVAVSENQLMEVPGVYTFFGAASEDSGIMLREAVASRITAMGTISPVLDGRVIAG